MKDKSKKDDKDGKEKTKFSKEILAEASPTKVKENKVLAIEPEKSEKKDEETPEKKKEPESLIAEEKTISGGIRYADFKNLFSFTIGFFLFFVFQFTSAFV
jgi:hypothetical protein